MTGSIAMALLMRCLLIGDPLPGRRPYRLMAAAQRPIHAVPGGQP